MAQSEKPLSRSRPTMRDVAALAGVSLKTVSRVVNGEPNVAPKLAEQVQRAATQLNYRPNRTASSLRRGDGRTAMIGLLLEDVGNPYSSSVERAVEDVAARRGVRVLAASLDEDPERERLLASALFERRVDGVIIVPASHDHGYLRDELEAGTAMVFVDRPARYLAADSVTVDNRAGAERGTAALIANGHTRIAYLGNLRSITTSVDRYDGYRDALARAGIAVDEQIVRHELHSMEAAQQATVELLRGDAPPTALFAGQNQVTIGAVRALHELGRAREVAVVGFDDFPLADLIEPAVAVVAQDSLAIGALAAEILFRRIEGDRSPAAEHVVPTTLLLRDSGRIAAPDR
jgi:LacI family transcriptional regulator